MAGNFSTELFTNLNVKLDPVIIFQSSKRISLLLHKCGPGPGKFKMTVGLILDWVAQFNCSRYINNTFNYNNTLNIIH